MSSRMDESADWKEIVACGAAFMFLCFGLATCQYVSHITETSTKIQVEVKK